MDTQLPNLNDMSEDELRDFVSRLGMKGYRAKQIARWLSLGASFEEMTDIPVADRELLAQNAITGHMRVVECLRSKVDGTVKFLFDLGDGNYIETVLMKYKYGYSVCVSTQAGCRMGCTFCASAKLGFARNLTASEIVAQVTAVSKQEKVRVSHVVLMGIGEPLDNYENTIEFMRRAHDVLGISYRKISLSTCGLVPQIERLMNEDIPVTLSVSLHSPFQEQRAEMMPIARKYSLDKLLEICNIYTLRVGRRITFEYAVIADVNDSDKHADELIRRLGSMLCHVNLIPVNSVEGTGYSRADKERNNNFCARLIAGGVNATVRRAAGRDIEAACGQLRRRVTEGEHSERK